MTRKWRPSLGMVLGGALCGTLMLSFIGLVVLRYLGPEIGFRNAAILLGAVITGATTVLGWLLVRLLLRPIIALEHFAMQVRADPVQPPSPPQHFGTQELRATAKSVLDMADTLRNRETTIRSFSDHVTHELKTPVSAIKAATELLQDSSALTAGDRRLVDQIAGAGAQMEQQLEALRDTARAREVRYDGVSSLGAVRGGLQGAFPELDLAVEGQDVPIPLAPQGLSLVLHHLLDNALRHGGHVVRLTASQVGTVVTIAVHDSGAGISQGNAPRVFDPFFTTSRENGGTGMGLSIVRNSLRANAADIALEPRAAGTRFVLTFEQT